MKERERQHEILLERFRFEAQISARLSAVTDRIVGVHDAGLFRGVPYLVMELAPGESLETRIDRAPLVPHEVAMVLEQIAQAVDAAHRAGLAHRDIKPANVLCQVGERGGYKLADFGVAKLFRDTSLGLDSPKKTTENVLVGSPAYMCPEYISGTPTTNGAGDIWAMAVLAYEALTQHIPFDGEAWTQVAVSIVQGKFVAPSRRIAGLGPQIDAFFTRAFSLTPEERFGTAAELARAFREAAEAVVIPPSAALVTQRVEPSGPSQGQQLGVDGVDPRAASEPPARRAPRALLWAGAALLVLTGALGAWRLFLSGTESVAAPSESRSQPASQQSPERTSAPAVDSAGPIAPPVEAEKPPEQPGPAVLPQKKTPASSPASPVESAPPVRKTPRKTNPSEVL